MKKILLNVLLVSISLPCFAQDTYGLLKDSKLTIDGTSTVHDWTVTANTMEGSAVAEGKSLKEIDFQVAVADIKSERGATMDKKMHDALKKESHPNIVFSLREMVNESTLAGTLTIAGNTQEVGVGVKIDADGDTMKIAGEHGIALKDWGIEPPTAMFGQVVVGDDVTVKFDLVFSKQ